MPILAKKIFFADEAHFDLGGYVNKQNCRIWGTENPHAYIKKLTHSKRVTVQCGFWSSFIKKIIFSDEAHFDLGGYVNNQNCRIWGTENPHAYIEKPTHPKRVAVWCGFWSKGIIGPLFFENKQGEAITVNENRYRTMLNEFLFIKIEEEDIGNIWFQQNGAKCHTAEATVDVLLPVFENRIISRRADVVWPAI